MAMKIFKAIASSRPVVYERYAVTRWVINPITDYWVQEKVLTSPVREFWWISQNEYAVMTNSSLYIVEIQEKR